MKISNTFIKINVLFSYQGNHFLKYSQKPFSNSFVPISYSKCETTK